MAQAIRDFHDLVRILEEHPQWRAELRRLVLSEELLRLPEELASFRAESERRFARLEEELASLRAESERRFARLEQALATLTKRVDQLTARVDRLAQVQERMLVDLGRLKGRDKEREFREKAPAYFGRHLAGLLVLSSGELVQVLEPALESGVLSFEEYEQVLASDLVATGRLRASGEEVYLVAEVSWGVGLGDLERALRRAGYLSRLGRRTLAAVGGEEVLPGVEEEALARGVIVVTDGGLSWPHLSGPS